MKRQETATAPSPTAKTPRRRWRFLAVALAGLLWLGVAALWLGLAVGHDGTLVEQYDEQGNLADPTIAMRYGWPWPYLAAYKAVFFPRPWHFWQDIEKVLWFSPAALVADVAFWLLGVAAWGWLLLRWCRSRRPWQFRLSSFLLTLGVGAVLLWPFVSTMHASGRGREAAQRLARLEAQDADRIVRLIQQDPQTLALGPGTPLTTYAHTFHELRFQWLWELLDVQPPQWAQVPVWLNVRTRNPRRALALAGRIPTLRSISISVLREEDLVSFYPLRQASFPKSFCGELPLCGHPPLEHGLSPEEARVRVAAIFQKHGLAASPVRAVDLEHLHRLPQLRYLSLSLPQLFSRQEAAVLARLPQVAWLCLNYPDTRRWIIFSPHLPEFLKMPRLRSLAVALHHEAVPEKIKQQFQRRGVKLKLLLPSP